jgi:hypothetical protein
VEKGYLAVGDVPQLRFVTKTAGLPESARQSADELAANGWKRKCCVRLLADTRANIAHFYTGKTGRVG